MSQIKIGGFFKESNRTSSASKIAADIQSDKMGILIPQVLYIGNPLGLSNQVIAQSQNKFSDDYSNPFIHTEMFKGMRLYDGAKIEFEGEENNLIVTKVYSISDSLKDLNNKFKIIFNTNDMLRTKLGVTTSSVLAGGVQGAGGRTRQVTRVKYESPFINVGKVFSSNFLENEEDNFITDPTFDDHPVPRFDIVTFYQDESSSFVLTLNNIKMSFSQNFRAFRKPSDNSRESSRISEVQTSLIIDSGNSLSGKIHYAFFAGASGVGGATGIFSSDIILDDNNNSFTKDTILTNQQPLSNEFNLTKIIKKINDEDYRNKKLFCKDLSEQEYHQFYTASSNAETINKTFLVPNTAFLEKYINLIFYTMLHQLYDSIQDDQEQSYKLVLIEFLVSLIFNKILHGNEFNSGKILKNKYVANNNNFNVIDDNSIMAYNIFIYEKLDLGPISDFRSDSDEDFFLAKQYKYPNLQFIDINNSDTKSSMPRLCAIYRDTLQKDFVIQALTLIYNSATYVKDVTDICSIIRTGDNYNIEINKEIFPVL